MNYKIVVINALVTFVEGFLAAWAVTGNRTDKEALIGACAAGVSLVYNVIVKPLVNRSSVRI